MSNKETPKWVKDDRGIDCVEYHGAHWYLNYYGTPGISVVFEKNKRFKVVDLISADADKAIVQEFIQKHPKLTSAA